MRGAYIFVVDAGESRPLGGVLAQMAVNLQEGQPYDQEAARESMSKRFAAQLISESVIAREIAAKKWGVVTETLPTTPDTATNPWI